MSILIKGMKMPKNCDKCILSSSTAMRCDATKKSLVTDTYPKRPSWCPLVKVPEPHGRLIDADKLCEYARNSTMGIDANDICRFPCVIEAEEQEHE